MRLRLLNGCGGGTVVVACHVDGRAECEEVEECGAWMWVGSCAGGAEVRSLSLELR